MICENVKCFLCCSSGNFFPEIVLGSDIRVFPGKRLELQRCHLRPGFPVKFATKSSSFHQPIRYGMKQGKRFMKQGYLFLNSLQPTTTEQIFNLVLLESISGQQSKFGWLKI